MSHEMTPMEQASLKHAKEWLVYAQSKQSALDLERDKARRAQLDRAQGHSPKCGILKCHHSCPKLSNK